LASKLTILEKSMKDEKDRIISEKENKIK